MADIKATKILQFGDGKYDRMTLAKKTAADVIEKGDLLKVTTGEVEKTANVTDDSTFGGVCAMDSADANGPQNILFYLRAICEMPMESAAYNFGAGLKGNYTNGTLEADGGANTIAHAWETKATTTSLKVMFDVLNLAKLFTVSA
jgi:hypothetical protein